MYLDFRPQIRLSFPYIRIKKIDIIILIFYTYTIHIQQSITWSLLRTDTLIMMMRGARVLNTDLITANYPAEVFVLVADEDWLELPPAVVAVSVCWGRPFTSCLGLGRKARLSIYLLALDRRCFAFWSYLFTNACCNSNGQICLILKTELSLINDKAKKQMIWKNTKRSIITEG